MYQPINNVKSSNHTRRIKQPRVFGDTQLYRLKYLRELAHELTGDFYCLGSYDLPYEVRTLVDLEEKEIHSIGIFADIARYEYCDSRFGRKHDLYRVNLQDHNILDSINRASNSIRFSPLMLYILTHELVHIVRFVKFITPFYQAECDQRKEEQRVHSITQNILSHISLPGIKNVLERFREHSLYTS